MPLQWSVLVPMENYDMRPGSTSVSEGGLGAEMNLGKLPPGWTTSTVGDLGTIRVGRQLSPDKLTGQYSTKYLRAANIVATGLDLDDVLEMDFTPDERRVYGLQPGDVLLAEASGSPDQVGRSALWTQNDASRVPGCCFQNTVIRFRPHAVLPQFALIVFRTWSLNGEFARLARGTGIQHLGSNRLATLPFPVPPLEEQARIADAVNNKRAEISGARASLEDALHNISLQNDMIRASVLDGTLVSGCNPREVEWTTATLAETGELQQGLQRTPNRLRGLAPLQYLRAANIASSGIDLSVGVFEMDFDESERARYSVSPDDLVIAEASGSSAQVGRAAICTAEVNGFGFQNTIIRYRPGTMTPSLRGLCFVDLLATEPSLAWRTERESNTSP